MENNFINNTMQPFTVFMNDFMQGETIFKKASTKLTYMYLYSLKNCASIFPSHETIAVATCTSVSTVKRTLSEIEELGLLEIEERPGFTSIYTLNDYYQVVQNKVAQNELGKEVVQNELPTQSKMNYPVGQNELRKLKTKNNITKNKISSSGRDSIDDTLRKKYNHVPFDTVKEQMLNDSVTINTDKQYKSLLEYRLKNWKPKQSTKSNRTRSTHKELVPEWLDKENEENNVTTKFEQPDSDFEIEKKKLEAELKQLDAELKAGNK